LYLFHWVWRNLRQWLIRKRQRASVFNGHRGGKLRLRHADDHLDECGQLLHHGNHSVCAAELALSGQSAVLVEQQRALSADWQRLDADGERNSGAIEVCGDSRICGHEHLFYAGCERRFWEWNLCLQFSGERDGKYDWRADI